MQVFSVIFQVFFLCGLTLTKNTELAEDFEQYRQCLEKVEQEIGEEKRIKVIHAIRGSDVVLPCFTCVSPEDGVEIDSTYKPSAGTVGRSMNSIVDFFKEKFMRSSFSMPDKNRWKFDWEFAMLGRQYVPLSSMHFSASESISDRIRRFTSKDDAEFKLGDRYELVLKNVDANSTGHYRCVNRHGRNVISNMYFLEVSNAKAIVAGWLPTSFSRPIGLLDKTVVRSLFSQLNGSLGIDKLPRVALKSGQFAKEKLKYSVKASVWSKCSYCSSDRGEQTRHIKCYLEPATNIDGQQKEYRYMNLYDKIACSSTLVPIKLRKTLRKMGNHVVFLETRPCFEPCSSAEEINRIVNSSQDLGDMRTLDYLPGGEFVFGNILPRLLPPVVRKVQLVLENDPQVLSCQKLIDLHAGVHWYSLKNGPIQHTNISQMYRGRAYFDEETNLVFREFTLEEDDEYFCYSSNNILLGTFHMRVVENDQHHQIIEVAVQIFGFSSPVKFTYQTMRVVLVLSLLVVSSSCFKILVSVPKFGYSHMKTMGKLADILVENGHDVTFLMPVDAPIPNNGTDLAKVVLVPTGKEVAAILEASMKSGAVANLWKHSANSKEGIMWSTDMLGQLCYFNTKSMIENEDLIRQMKDEKFDIGITELFDFSGLAFFEVIGLKNVIGAHTTSVFEGTLLATGAPVLPSFVPGSQTFTDDSGSLLSRLYNLYMTYWSYEFQNKIQGFSQKALDEHYGKGKAPRLWDLVSRITWFFVNSDPIFDFPKPLPRNIVEIAGISVSKTKPVGKEWDAFLNKRQKNVLVSFGSIASPTTMPEAVKKSIVDTFAAFPDVTFIWKYDDTESQLTAHLDNVHIVRWMPQNDLLADKRITMFWTHGGMGSLMESAQKGVPLVVVPIFGDQMRNAQIAKRHGIAIIHDKMELTNTKKLIGSLREVLENPEYKKSADLLARILTTERISPRQRIVDTVELAGRFGQMPRWTSSGREFSLLKYFNIDIIILFAVLVLSVTLLIFMAIRRILVKLGFSGSKEKSE